MIDGVVLLPSALGITTASLPSITETQELSKSKSPDYFTLYLYLIIVYTYFNNSLLKSITMPIQEGP
jgi:hypothetical protein